MLVTEPPMPEKIVTRMKRSEAADSSAAGSKPVGSGIGAGLVSSCTGGSSSSNSGPALETRRRGRKQ